MKTEKYRQDSVTISKRLGLLVSSVCIRSWIFVLGICPSGILKKEFVDREIDKQEFKKVMALMRSQNRQGANHRDGRRLGAKTSIENGGLLEYFFGKDGNTCLQHERFVQFLRQLHDEVCVSPLTSRSAMIIYLRLYAFRFNMSMFKPC